MTTIYTCLLQWLLYLIITFTSYLFSKNLFNKLSNLPPSPFLSFPFFGHLYLTSGQLLHHALAKVSKRYGPIVFLQFGSRPILVINSPELAEECFTKNDITFANRPKLLAAKHIGANYSSVTWTSYGDHWRNLRKISAIEILSTYRLESLRGIREDEVKDTIRVLNRKAEEGKHVDMKVTFFELMMNVVMRMIVGKKYYGENVEDAKVAEMFREITKETLRLGGANIGDFMPVMKWLGSGGVEKKMKELENRRNAFMQGLVEERRKRLEIGEVKAKTVIEMLLELQRDEPDYYTDAMIRSLIQALLLAGSDTSASTMEWALSLLVNNPHVLKKAQSEIDQKIGHGRLMNESDVAHLSYLRCIVSETLRFHSPGLPLIPHESGAACTVGGYRVPSGTMLLVNIWAIQNDPKHWENPEEFKPERFEGLQGHRDGFKLIPFGVGRRGCPGEGLAVRMLGLGLGSLIQCFDWERIGEELEDMTEGTGLTSPKAKPLVAVCKPRPVASQHLSQI